jgi:PAS domain S-box-containing protein
MKGGEEQGRDPMVVSIDGREQFDQLISHFFDILVLIDENGFQHYISPSCEKIVGYRPEELRGVSVIETFIHPEDQEKTRGGLWNIIHQGKNGGTQYRHRHKNGGWVYLEAFGTNQLRNPAIRSVVLNVRDITERKKTEEALVESRLRLKELNATKDRLFSIIGHDLKNPVGNIVSLSDLILGELPTGDTASIESYARLLRQTSTTALDLLSNLLSWARSQTGSISFQPQSVDLRTLTRNALDLLRGNALQKAITLENRIPEGFQVRADPDMLELVLRNLVSNGIKFTPENGTVTIRITENREGVTVMVEDSGIGIPPEDVGKLFSPECHYSTRGTRQEAGTGLGLLLCREFVERHGGEIQVESVEGKGSRFAFTLPRQG